MNRIATPLMLFAWISAGVAGWSVVAPGDGAKEAPAEEAASIRPDKTVAVVDDAVAPPGTKATTSQPPSANQPTDPLSVVLGAPDQLATDNREDTFAPEESSIGLPNGKVGSGRGIPSLNHIGQAHGLGVGAGAAASTPPRFKPPRKLTPRVAGSRASSPKFSPAAVANPPMAAAANSPQAPQSPLPPLSDNQIDVALRGLPLGSIAFNTPEEIPLGESAVIELLLSMKETQAELAPAVAPAGPVETARVRFSNQMQAELRGLGFEIEPITPELQAISHTERTRWRWQIMPIDTDAQDLHLTLSARVRVDGEGMMRTIETFEREIQVRVPLTRRVTDFVAGNSELVFSLLLAPLAAAGWRWWRRRKGRGATEEAKVGIIAPPIPPTPAPLASDDSDTRAA